MSNLNYKKIFGIIFFLLGIAVLVSNIKVGGFYFGRGAASGGFILLLMGIDFVLMIMKKDKIYKMAMILLSILLIISVITNIRVFLGGMSLIKYILIAGFMFGGIGLFLKGKEES